jgi:UDP-N-acetylmuramoyl-tripeptide--D-alanyl-D-alanine ligase
MKVEHIFTGSREDVLIELQKSLKPGDWVLVKGSRGARMDAVVEGLKQWAGVEKGTSDEG